MFRCVPSVCFSCLFKIPLFPSFLLLSSRAKVPTHEETNTNCLLHTVRRISSAELRSLTVTMTNNDNSPHQSVCIMASGYGPKILTVDFLLCMSVNNIYRKTRKMFLPGKYTPQAVFITDWERSAVK